MLLKIIGSILVIAASSTIGLIFSRDLSKRPQELRLLQGILQMLENEICFLSNVLLEAFEKIYRTNKCDISDIFRDTISNIKADKGLTTSIAWENAVKKNIKKTSLNKEDEEILISFGTLLGRSDVEGQIKNIRLTMNQLKIQEYKAEDLRKKNEAMFRNLGILGGLALVIVLF